MKYDVLFNFISPVTGRVLCTTDYVLYGDGQGVATPSPVIIDIKLDHLNLLQRVDQIASTDLVVGNANNELPNAQVLYNMSPGYMYNFNGIVTTTPGTPNTPFCYAATTSNLSFAYDNGTSGVGATLTATSLGAFTVDGVNPPLNSNILVKNQLTTYENGIYVLTTVGDTLTYAVLTRSPNYDTAGAGGEIQAGDLVLVEFGTTHAKSMWVETQEVTTIGTDPILFDLWQSSDYLPYQNVFIGNMFDRPAPSPIIFINNLPDLTFKRIWRGNQNVRPMESDDLTIAERNISTLQIRLGDALKQLSDLTTIINNTVQTVKAIQSILDGIGTSLGYLALIALVSQIEATLLYYTPIIDKILETLGYFYPSNINYKRPLFVEINYIKDDITNLQAAILNLRLCNIPAGGNVSFDGYRGINFATPISPYDAANKFYVDLLTVSGTEGQVNVASTWLTETGPHKFTVSLALSGVVGGTYPYANVTVDLFGRITAISSGSNSIELSGPVTGTGVLGSPITTAFHLGLDQISTLNPATGTIDFNNQRGVEVADPIDPQDAVNLRTLEGAIPAYYYIILEGDVIGEGPSNLPIVTTMVKTLNNIQNAGDVNIAHFKLINVSDATDAEDAVNLRVLNQYIGALHLDGFIVGGPPVGGVILTSPGPSCLLKNIQPGGDVSLDGYRLTNVGDIQEETDALNFRSFWEILTTWDWMVSRIRPQLHILGNTQQFIYNDYAAVFELKNTFVPNSLVPSSTATQFTNSNYSGFRIRHETASTENSGNLRFERYINAEQTGDAFVELNETADEVIIYKDMEMSGKRVKDLAFPTSTLDETTIGDAISLDFFLQFLSGQVTFKWQ